MIYFYFLESAILVFTFALLVLCIRRCARDVPKGRLVSPDVAGKHLVLIYLIRGTGACITAVTALFALYLSIRCVIDAFRGEMGTAGWPGILFAVTVIVSVMGLISYVGYGMWLRVDESVLANFAFVFAFLLAVVWYHLLPTNLPRVIIDYFGNNPFFVPFRGSNPNPSYRAALSYLAFFLFYKLIRAYLFQVFDFKPQARANSLPTDDPSIPEFPQKSPLVEL
jgi:hypothetical protein